MTHVFEKFFKENPSDPNNDANIEVKLNESNEPVKPQEKRITGKIIKISDDGWGFISSKEIKFTRIFFHWTSLKQDTIKFQELRNGMKVEFTPVEVQDKGWRAIKIKVVE